MTSLLLFNPKEQPYGVLSPLYDDIVSKSYVELIKDINIELKAQKFFIKNSVRGNWSGVVDVQRFANPLRRPLALAGWSAGGLLWEIGDVGGAVSSPLPVAQSSAHRECSA